MAGDNTPENIQQMIERGEMAREHGEHAAALQYLDEALIAAADSQRPADIITVLGHRLLIYKHLAQSTGKDIYYELMFGDTLNGLRLAEAHNISGVAKADMLLRQGDYFLVKKDNGKAVELFEQAIELLDLEGPSKNRGRYAEYLGHYGLSLVLAGDSSGLTRLAEALTLVEHNEELRPFHKLIILSGMHGRYVQAYVFLGDKAKATQHLDAAEKLAQELIDEHDISVRMDQMKKLRKTVNSLS